MLKHFVLAVVLCAGIGALRAQEQPAKPQPEEMTEAKLAQQVSRLFRQQKYAEAETLLQQLVKLNPKSQSAHYNLACALARQGKVEDAYTALSNAVAAGYLNINHMKADPDLEALRNDKRFSAILAKAAQAAQQRREQLKAHVIANGVTKVEETNSAFHPGLGVFRVMHAFPEDFKVSREAVKGYDKLGHKLRKWYLDGEAAGLHGILYDNHDRDHSNMDYKNFPQLTRIEYGKAAAKRGMNNGRQVFFIHNLPVIGNSSTALTRGPFWRSNPRLSMVNPREMRIIYNHYVANHLYFYPEHRDHDKDKGDVYPANTPYLIISQGSSGSDRAFMSAVALTLAAFKSETQRKLIQAGILVPTVQMIFRRANKQVETPEDYLSGKAHPTVFQGGRIDRDKMVDLAHAMTVNEIPAMVQLRIVKEEKPQPGVDYFVAGKANESLFTTPAAIARIFRGKAYRRKITISAAGSKDINQRELRYHWVLLRGDPTKVQIKPQNDSKSAVEITVAHHEKRPIREGAKLQSSRVDIGCFVHNGANYSAPGFVTFYFLNSERRVYNEQKQIVSIEHKGGKGRYVDPLIEPAKNWKDTFQYTPDGKLRGWIRTRPKGAPQPFTRHGALVLNQDDAGRPRKAITVRYVGKRGKKGAPHLEQVMGKEILVYQYKDDKDLLGKVAERKSQ